MMNEKDLLKFINKVRNSSGYALVSFDEKGRANYTWNNMDATRWCVAHTIIAAKATKDILTPIAEVVKDLTELPKEEPSVSPSEPLKPA